MSFIDVGLAALETVKVNGNGRSSVKPYLVLGYANEEINAISVSDYHGRSFVDIGRQLMGENGSESVYDWEEGVADSFKAAYENSDLDFELTGIHMTDTGSLRGRIHTDLGGFDTDYGTAALAGVLTDADFKVEESVIENVESPDEIGIEDGTGAIPVNFDYEPQAVERNGEKDQEWRFQGRVKGSLERPRSSPQESYNGESLTTGEDVYANIIENSEGESRALLFDPVKLTDYSWKQFEFDSNQNSHFLEKPQKPKYLRGPEVENHLLTMSDTDIEYSASVEEVGWVNISETLEGNPEVEHPAIVRPREAYARINGDVYTIPANLQNLVPALTESINIESGSGTGWDRTYQ